MKGEKEEPIGCLVGRTISAAVYNIFSLSFRNSRNNAIECCCFGLRTTYPGVRLKLKMKSNVRTREGVRVKERLREWEEEKKITQEKREN